jgi:tetratricopeptide (TPR) repeat protein
MSHYVKNLIVTAGFVFLLAVILQTQASGQVTAEQRQQANDFYQAQDWAKVIDSYQAISRLEPQNANALYRLGVGFHQLKKYQEATDAYERSEKINNNPSAAYNLACIYSMAGEKEKAFSWLDKAITAGFGSMSTFQTDKDLDNIRGTKEYKLLEEKLDKAIRPCEYDPAARQFDFWVGDWDVKTQQGQNAGKNTVQKLEDGCLLLENWTSSIRGTGKSINFFDKQANKWRQIWVDNSGNSTLFTGEFKAGSMRYEAESTGADGKKTPIRLTFTPLDKTHVRQYGEKSTDDGKTWTITYDFVYVLKSENK